MPIYSIDTAYNTMDMTRIWILHISSGVSDMILDNKFPVFKYPCIIDLGTSKKEAVVMKKRHSKLLRSCRENLNTLHHTLELHNLHPILAE